MKTPEQEAILAQISDQEILLVALATKLVITQLQGKDDGRIDRALDKLTPENLLSLVSVLMSMSTAAWIKAAGSADKAIEWLESSLP